MDTTNKGKRGMPPVVEPHLSKQTYYWPTYEDAVNARDLADPRFAKHARIREYTVGFAVQLHDSGEYLGPQVDSYKHRCPWCPADAWDGGLLPIDTDPAA